MTQTFADQDFVSGKFARPKAVVSRLMGLSRFVPLWLKAHSRADTAACILHRCLHEVRHSYPASFLGHESSQCTHLTLRSSVSRLGMPGQPGGLCDPKCQQAGWGGCWHTLPASHRHSAPQSQHSSKCCCRPKPGLHAHSGSLFMS